MASLYRETARNDALIVMESALLHWPVFVTLRRGPGPETIVDFLPSVADISPVAPRLVYLAAPDPDAAYRATTARRGGRGVDRNRTSGIRNGSSRGVLSHPGAPRLRWASGVLARAQRDLLACGRGASMASCGPTTACSGGA